MSDTGPDSNYPPTLPAVQILPYTGEAAPEVTCNELQWWFVVPRIGDVSGAAWYDRDTGRLARVKETARPVARSTADADAVTIDIDEWCFEPGDETPSTPNRFTFEAALTDDRAEFRAVTTGGSTVSRADPRFAAEWIGPGTRRIVDDGRYRRMAERRYQTSQAHRPGAGLVELVVDDRRFSCLRVLDVPVTDGSDEIGQPLIDLATGRTLAYWQYRPLSWDADSADWIRDHPGCDITIDSVTFQRRNCTGRDTIALTRTALGID